MKLYLILICLTLTLISCTLNVKEKVIADSHSGRCEQAIEAFNKNFFQEKSYQKAKQITGATASGTLTGVTIVSETVVYLASGLVIGTLVCSPIIAVEASTKSSGRASVECVMEMGRAATQIFAPKGENLIAYKVWENTKKWRVESYDDLSLMLRSAAKCFASRDTFTDLTAAENQLRAIRESLWEKLSDTEQGQVDTLINEIQIRKTLMETRSQSLHFPNKNASSY